MMLVLSFVVYWRVRFAARQNKIKQITENISSHWEANQKREACKYLLTMGNKHHR